MLQLPDDNAGGNSMLVGKIDHLLWVEAETLNEGCKGAARNQKLTRPTISFVFLVEIGTAFAPRNIDKCRLFAVQK